MSRHVWRSLLVVVTVLVVASFGSRWYAPTVAWLHATTPQDLLGSGERVGRLVQAYAAVNVAWIGAAVAGLIALTAIAGIARRRRKLIAATAGSETSWVSEPAPAAESEPQLVAQPAAAFTTARPAATATSAGRRARVDSLLARGWSVADIAKATGIGQDAIRSATRST